MYLKLIGETMKDKIDWIPGWINVAVKIVDLSVCYSYSHRKEELEHKCRDHIDLIGEVVFSDYKKIKKGDRLKFTSFVDHEDEIKELDQTINPKDEKGNWRSITIRELREERDAYKCVGYLGPDMNGITMDDRFWDRYTLMKLQGKDVYLSLDCKREKRREPMVLGYSLKSEFDVADYE